MQESDDRLYTALSGVHWTPNPEIIGHPIRFSLDTQSGNDWTVNPVFTGHFFGSSGFSVQLVSD